MNNITPDKILKKYFFLIIAIYAAFGMVRIFFHHDLVQGDGKYYFSYLHEIVFDRNFNFRNEYRQMQALEALENPDYTHNKFSIGPAIFWLAPYLYIHTLLLEDGLSLPYQITVFTANIFYTLTGLVLLLKILIYIVPVWTAGLTVVFIALTTNLLYYGSVDTINSHALSFLMSTVFVSLIVQNRKSYGFGLGFTLGLIFIIRPQDVIIGLLIITILKKVNFFKFLIGLFISIIPQLASNLMMYKQIFISSYLFEGETFNFFNPKIVEVLFSYNYGLFTITPIILIAFIFGIFILIKNRSVFLLTATIIIIIQIYLVSVWHIYWQGATYGGRMFVSLLPLFAINLAYFIDKFPYSKSKQIITALIILTAVNLINIAVT